MPILFLVLALLGTFGLPAINIASSMATPADAIFTSASQPLAQDALDEEFDDDDRQSAFKVHALDERPAAVASTLYGARPAVTLLAALRKRTRGS